MLDSHVFPAYSETQTFTTRKINEFEILKLLYVGHRQSHIVPFRI